MNDAETAEILFNQLCQAEAGYCTFDSCAYDSFKQDLFFVANGQMNAMNLKTKKVKKVEIKPRLSKLF